MLSTVTKQPVGGSTSRLKLASSLTPLPLLILDTVIPLRYWWLKNPGSRTPQRWCLGRLMNALSTSQHILSHRSCSVNNPITPYSGTELPVTTTCMPTCRLPRHSPPLVRMRTYTAMLIENNIWGRTRCSLSAHQISAA